MGLSAGTVWEIRTTGSDTNGGGFNAAGSSPGTDRSQQDAAQVFIDGSTISATVHTTTTQITLVGHTVTSADNRNLLNITGGTATAGVYEITAIDAVNNRWTLDRSAGTSTQTVVGRMGGAFASPGYTAGKLVTSNQVWQKAGTYSCSSTANVSNGRVNLFGENNIRWEGYSVTRDDMAAKPVLQATSNSMTIFTAGGLPDWLIRGLEFSGSGQTSITGFSLTAAGKGEHLKATACASAGFSLTGSGAKLVLSEATGCGGIAGAIAGSSGVVHFAYCVSHDNTSGVAGFYLNGANGSTIEHCISKDNTGNGFYIASNSITVRNCVAVNNTGAGINGFETGSNRMVTFHHCIAVGNTLYGFRSGTGSTQTMLFNSQTYNNGTSATNGTFGLIDNHTALSGNPFTDPTTDDLSLNDTAGAGAACKSIDIELPSIASLSHEDSGAVLGESVVGGGTVPLPYDMAGGLLV